MKREQILRLMHPVLFLMVILVLGASTLPLSAQNVGDRWETVYTNPGLPFRAIENNGSIFVAVGDNGLVMTSTDGRNWTTRNAGTTANLYGIGYGNGLFVAVGYEGALTTSPNGIAWTVRDSKLSSGLWGVAYGNNTYVVVGLDGSVATSPDGITWTKQNAGTTKPFKAATFGNNLFVAVGNAGAVYTSADGIVWSNHSIAIDTNLYSVLFADDLFLLGGGDGVLYTSLNGTSWTKRKTGVLNYFWQMAYCDGNYWLACSKAPTDTKAPVLKSSDGITWTRIYTQSTSNLRGISGMGTVLIAVGDRRTIEFSDNTPVPDLTVFSPNGGETLTAGSSHTISWKAAGPTNVKLEYSTNGGTSWTTIIESTPNDGNHAWTVPAVASSQCRVKVSDAEDGTPSDTSNVNFTITVVSDATIRFTAPNGGETLAGGSNFSIHWTGSKTFQKIDIEYYDGNAWKVVVSQIADTGSYSWKVPDISTTKARLWIKGWHTSGNAMDYTDATFTILPSGQAPMISIVTPNGGETLFGGSIHDITWSDNRTFTRIDMEYYNGSKWVVIASNVRDDNHYNWTVPNVSTTKAKIWIKGYHGDGNVTDYSNAVFTISSAPAGKITVTSPNGGEGFKPGETRTITWTSTGTVGNNVVIYYSTNNGRNWSTVVSLTANNGSYAWLVPNVISDECLVRVVDASNTAISDVSNNIFSIGGDPEIVLNRDQFVFGCLLRGSAPGSQDLLISNKGSGQLSWTASADMNWISVSPGSGTGDAIVKITVNPAGLNVGQHEGHITINSTNAINAPLTVNITLTVKTPAQDQEPFGAFEVPENGLTGVSGAIAVTGWALDDIEVAGVRVYWYINGELSPLGDAVFVEGARPDVEELYSTYPHSARAGWGYMLLTNFLPEGELVLKAIATDTTGHEVELGTRTIYLDHTHAVKPFGAIDTPTQGGNASGSIFWNQGWVLTPQPNNIPANGSTINVFIDGVYVGKAAYGDPRTDIASFFPGYANTNGPGAHFGFDTTTYVNGVHTISWGVTDSAGNSDGIGSRFFMIANTGNRSTVEASTAQPQDTFLSNRSNDLAVLNQDGPVISRDSIKHIPVDDITPVSVRKGYDEDSLPGWVIGGSQDVDEVKVKQLERLETGFTGRCVAGYQRVGNELRRLPIGSTLDTEKGKFYWQLTPGFLGKHNLVFIIEATNGELYQKEIWVNILPF